MLDEQTVGLLGHVNLPESTQRPAGAVFRAHEPAELRPLLTASFASSGVVLEESHVDS